MVKKDAPVAVTPPPAPTMIASTSTSTRSPPPPIIASAENTVQMVQRSQSSSKFADIRISLICEFPTFKIRTPVESRGGHMHTGCEMEEEEEEEDEEEEGGEDEEENDEVARRMKEWASGC